MPFALDVLVREEFQRVDRTKEAIVNTLRQFPGVTKAMINVQTRRYSGSTLLWNEAFDQLVNEGVLKVYHESSRTTGRTIAVYRIDDERAAVYPVGREGSDEDEPEPELANDRS